MMMVIDDDKFVRIDRVRFFVVEVEKDLFIYKSMLRLEFIFLFIK